MNNSSLLYDLNKGYQEVKLLLDKGDLNNALELVLRYIDFDTGDSFAELRLQLGFILRKKGRFIESEEAYRYAISIDPELGKSWSGLSGVLLAMGRFQESEEACKKALSINSEEAKFWNQLAVLFYTTGRYSECDEAYFNAVRLNLNADVLWLNFAGLYDTLIKIYSDHDPIMGGDLYSCREICFNRAYYLGCTSRFQYFDNIDQYPYLVTRLANQEKTEPRDRVYYEVVNKSVKASAHLKSYIAYLILSNRDKSIRGFKVADVSWFEWVAIINYYMGDPFMVKELMEKYVSTKKITSGQLRGYYYKLINMLQCIPLDTIDFSDPLLEEMQETLNLCMDYIVASAESTVANSWLYSKRVEHIYYAGLIVLLSEDQGRAIEIYSRIYDHHLPTAYKMLTMLDDSVDHAYKKVLSSIVNQELVRKKSGMIPFYSMGRKRVLRIDQSEDDDWTMPFREEFHFQEVVDGIEIFAKSSEYSKLSGNDEYLPPLSFYEIFHLSDEDVKYVLEMTAKDFYEELVYSLEKVKFFERDSSHTVDIDQSVKRGGTTLLTKYELLKERSTEDIVINIGKDIEKEQKLRTSLCLQDYYNLTLLFYLEERIEFSDKFFLDYYALLVLRNSNTEISLGVRDGIRDTIKQVGYAINNLTEDLLNPVLGGKIVINFTKYFGSRVSSAVIAQEFLDYWTSQKPVFESFRDYQRGYKAYFGEKLNQLGEERFRKKFPVEDFYDHIVR